MMVDLQIEEGSPRIYTQSHIIYAEENFFDIEAFNSNIITNYEFQKTQTIHAILD